MSFLITTFSLIFSLPLLAGVQATMNIDTKDPYQGMNKAKVFIDGKNFRMDTELPQGQGSVSYIVNTNKNKRYSLMHDQKRAMILPNTGKKKDFFTSGELVNISAAKKHGYKVEKLGTEKIEGHKCNIYRVTGTTKKHMKSAKAWFAPGLDGLMMKIEGTDADGSKMKVWMSNVTKKSLSSKLFTPPKGYKVSSLGNTRPFQQSSMINQMQEIQKLPPSQRSAAMEKWKKQMQEQASKLRKMAQ